MTTADGSKYWASVGHGGHSSTGVYTWAESQDFTLETSGDIVFGDYQLGSTANISHVQMDHSDQWRVPSTSTLTCLVTNDGGSTWEEYDWANDSVHRFTSTGNTVQVKYELTGNGLSAPHFQGHFFPTLTVMSMDDPPPVPTTRYRTDVKGVL